MLDNEKYFNCSCADFSHTLRFVIDLDRGSDYPIPTIYTETKLNHYLPWYKRIWIGIRYIFGNDYVQPYACWEINSQGDDPKIMIGMLQQLVDEQESIKQSHLDTIRNKV